MEINSPLHKIRFSPLLWLILIFNSIATGQSLQLKVSGESDTYTAVIDSFGYTANHENVKAIFTECNRLVELLQREGFLEVSPDTIFNVNDTLYKFNLTLNKKTRVHHIYIDTTEVALDGFTELGKTKNPIEIPFKSTEAFLENIVGNYEKAGDPFAEVFLERLSIQSDTLKSRLVVKATIRRKLTNVIVQGYEQFPNALIRMGTRLKQQTLFNRDLVITESRKLGTLPFLEEIKPPEILFTKDSTTAYLYLKKTSANFFDGFLGFASNETTGNVNLNGYVDLTLINNLNSAEEFTLTWKNNGQQQTNFATELTLPYLFNSKFGLNAGLRIFKQDSTFSNTHTNANLNYHINLNSLVSFGLEGATSNNLLGLQTESLADYDALFYKLQFKKRVPWAFAILGDKINIDVAAFTGKRATDAFDSNQQKIVSAVAYQFRVFPFSTIYLRNLTSLLVSDNYLTNELFFTGGINSIRGFNENSIAATFYSILNTEFRQLLGSSLYFSGFADVGYVEQQTENANSNLIGLGFGLGLRTGGGVFKLNYAVGSTDLKFINLSESKIHISFSTFF